MRIPLMILSLLLSACVSLPSDIKPVENFELERYLGTWYEIARLDHKFERGLSSVTARYTLRDDGSVRVINLGYSEEEDEWKAAEGKAYFVEDEDIGFLKVSFFGPLYGAYVIFELDHENYQYALVCGPSRSYLWILARTPKLDQEILDRLIEKAEAQRFDTEELIFVEHNRSFEER